MREFMRKVHTAMILKFISLHSTTRHTVMQAPLFGTGHTVCVISWVCKQQQCSVNCVKQ